MARYNSQTKETILQRMLDSVSNDIDKRQGSVTYDMLSPASLELAQAFIQLDNVLTFGFVSEDTPPEFLDLRSAELGVYRKKATKATGTVTFSGTDGVVINSGTRVSTDSVNPIYFVTTETKTIENGAATVTVEAEEEGTSGNVAANTIVLVLSDISGVTSVTNSASLEGGTEQETDESLIDRYLERVQNPSTSGNSSHYTQWSKEVAGVYDAKIFPLHAGNGTVKVVLLSDDKRSPSQTVIDNATSHIEENRPIGASVTVAGVTETAINVSATITLSEGYSLTDAQLEIEAELKAYFADLAFVDTVVRYSRIANAIIDCKSVKDYADLLVNSGTINVTIADDSVAVVGTVTLS